MNSFLSISPDNYGENIIETLGFGKTVAFGGMMVLIGMLTVFAALVLIWGCLTLFKVLFHDVQSKKTVKVETEPVVAEPVEIVSQTDDEELIAVISAAVAAAESENDGLKFRVVSFRRL